MSRFTAIVTPPQRAILAAVRTRTLPGSENGELRPFAVLNATVSADHRAGDGVGVARFLATLADLLQQPEALDG